MHNCYFCLFPYECGCEGGSIPVEKPDGYPDPPNEFLCPSCNRHSKAIYKEDRKYCAICFIPCCLCDKTPPYLACEHCNFRFASINYTQCTNCSSYNPTQAKHCYHCGNQNEGYNPNALGMDQPSTFEQPPEKKNSDLDKKNTEESTKETKPSTDEQKSNTGGMVGGASQSKNTSSNKKKPTTNLRMPRWLQMTWPLRIH